MRRRWAGCGVAIAAWCLGGCVSAPRFDGPMAVRNQHPTQLIAQRMLPRGASAVPAGGARVDWSNAYSSYFLGAGNGASSFVMDGELWRSALATRIGLGRGFDLGFEVPLVHAGGGFLDRFVIDWHESFGFADQGRTLAAKDDFRIRAEQGGATLYTLEPYGVHLGDLPLEVGWTALDPGPGGPLGLAFRAGVELPTGDQDRGYGNGGLDFALGVVGEWRVETIAFTGQLSWTRSATPRAMRTAGVELGDVASLDLGAEVAVTDDLAVLVQSQFESSSLRELGFSQVADDQWLLWVGLRGRLSERSRIEFAIGEDLSRYVSPDFSAWLALSFDL